MGIKRWFGERASEGWNKKVTWLPRTEVANILDHLQRALHLHQAVEWRAALGQRMPARREQHLGGCGSVTHRAFHYLSVLCPWCAKRIKPGSTPARPNSKSDKPKGSNKCFCCLPDHLQRWQESLRVWVCTGWWLPSVVTLKKNKKQKQKYPSLTMQVTGKIIHQEYITLSVNFQKI